MSGPAGSSQWIYATEGYQIQNSCRFDAAGTPKIVNTPSNASNRKTFTWSSWVKRSSINGTHVLFGALDASGRDNIYFQDTDRFVIEIMGTVSTTTQVFRDLAAWYHIVVVVDTTQGTNTNRIKLYVNGARVTDFSTGPAYPSQDTDGDINDDVLHVIGKDSWASRTYHFDGYLSEVHFIDGTAYQADSFGEYNKYGQWVPIKPQVTYGTNGFSMLFNSSGNLGLTGVGGATDVGSNYASTNLAAPDQMTDTPTNNFATFNPLETDLTQANPVVFTEGNLFATTPVSGNGNCFTTMGVKSGKFYAEILHQADSGSSAPRLLVGVSGDTNGTVQHTTTIGALTTNLDVSYHSQTGIKFNNNTEATYGNSFAVDDIIGIALNADDNEVTFFKNNSSQGAITLAAGGTYHFAIGDTSAGGGGVAVLNCGQDCTFSGNVTAANNTDEKGRGEFKYTPPAGFLALCTKNLPEPDIIPSDYFNTILYTGNAGTNNITGLDFQPDWVWMKNRVSDYFHSLYDSVRGTGTSKSLYSNTDDNEGKNSAFQNLTAFNSDGFSLGATSDTNVINTNSEGHVAWNWKAGNATLGTGAFTQGSLASTCSRSVEAGFSIVSYTGNETAGATVGHGLSKAPEMIIVKNRTLDDEPWRVFHAHNTGSPATEYLTLNTSAATVDNAAFWNDTMPSATVFTLGQDAAVNGDEATIAYCFHSVDDYSKLGSYFGNGNANGAFVYTGFRPAWVLLKKISNAANGSSWCIHDNKRLGYNNVNDRIRPNTSGAEDDDGRVEIVSNGFKMRVTYQESNEDNVEYVYMAFAETPFKYSNAR